MTIDYWYPPKIKIHSKVKCYLLKSSVIRQKGESQNGSFKKTMHVKFSVKTNISYPPPSPAPDTHTYVPCFLETPVLRFSLLPYYRRNEVRRYSSEIPKNLRCTSFSLPCYTSTNYIFFWLEINTASEEDISITKDDNRMKLSVSFF